MFDTITTIDRYPDSLARGQQGVPAVFLWRRPGGAMIADNLTGALAHGSKVCVLERTQYRRETWAKVRRYQGGRWQVGWCKSLFLEHYGK